MGSQGGSTVSDYTMTIGGRAVSTPRTFGVINPATGEVAEQAPDCTRDQLDEAIAAAASALPEWRRDEPARRKALQATADLMFARSEETGRILTLEQGKPLKDATTEVVGAGVWLKYFADLELPREIIQDDDAALVEVVRRPVGVVAAILAGERQAGHGRGPGRLVARRGAAPPSLAPVPELVRRLLGGRCLPGPDAQAGRGADSG
jgi:delta 1-pyrroline-5-carboxylate dehydrogenase